MQQKLFIYFLPQEAGAFRNNRKETAKATAKTEKYVCYIFTDNICSVCNPMQVIIFCKSASIL